MTGKRELPDELREVLRVGHDQWWDCWHQCVDHHTRTDLLSARLCV